MKNHILKTHNDPAGDQQCLLLKVEGAYDKEHEMMLEVANSPRMGECGYGGDHDDYIFDPQKIKK